ncbi:MAG TPA: hypothetical protein VHC47_08705, partial [Mucilaginibacter sp.]|nr:hypothetical protein [Mucilaginibacter sp.]
PAPGVWRNEQISSGKRSDFHDLNKSLLTGLDSNKMFMLTSILSKDMLADPSNLRTIELISNRLKEAKYHVLDEFYIVSAKSGKHHIAVTNQGVRNYTLDYDAVTKEMYIVFFVPETEANKYMISAVYRKFNYGWKVDQLAVNHYTSNGLTAPELYELAKADYAKHYLVDAVNNTAEAKDCETPFDGWQYQDMDGIEDFYSQVLNEANKAYRFPYVLDNVKTHPKIFRLYTQKSADGVFPAVYYMSSVKLADTTALKRENDEVKKVIGKILPGIDRDKKYIFYSIFNQWPRWDESVDRYNIWQKLQ